jgi:MFS family permease
MTKAKQTSGKVFHGWWVVLVAGVGLSLSYGPIIVTTFGVFLKPLSQEFGWSRAEVSLAFSLSILAMTGVGPLIGRLVDRLGARRVIVLSVLIFGLGVISFDFLSASLWHFYAIYLVIGVAGSGTTPVPYSQVIARWFDKKRGLALGLAMAGIQLGAFITPPLAQALMAERGRDFSQLSISTIGNAKELKQNPDKLTALEELGVQEMTLFMGAPQVNATLAELEEAAQALIA